MKQLVILEQKKKPTKLSEAWRLASKELKQIRVAYGSRLRKTACAIGALSYYFANDNDNLSWIDNELPEDIMDQLATFTKNSNFEYGKFVIWDYNDNQCWSFERFAEEAEKIGL